MPRATLDRAIDAVKARCGIADCGKRLLGTLSKGYQQRVGIAQAIIHEPDVVVLDEPTVGLDPIQIREIRHLIRSLAAGRSVLLSTHILPEVETICDRVEILHRGRIVFSDSITALNRFTRGLALKAVFRNPPDPSVLDTIAGVTRVEVLSANTFRIDRQDEPDPTTGIVERSVREGWGLVEIGPIRERLEDVFVELTRSER
jgi:ABC-2 type transport system ATP-binding protein